MKKESRASERLEESRREVQARFNDLRQSLDRELGWVPSRMWWLPVVGFACGLALAGTVGKKRSRRVKSSS